jgi:hypothetical protein
LKICKKVLKKIKIYFSYEGEKDKGLFNGYGKAVYKGGNIYEVLIFIKFETKVIQLIILKIIIKGEFVDGMMSGKGKYIWTNGIIYEGEFLNNEIIGTGVFRWYHEE